MTINSLSCPAPIRRTARIPKPDFELFDSAVDLFGEGKCLESLHKVLQHLFPDRTIPDLSSETFAFPQGSSRVFVQLSQDELTIRVPLVRLPAGGKSTAALRFLLTRMSSSGQLHQPRLRGDDVFLEFRDRLSRLHPLKVIEVLRRMPTEADNNDDWMVDQFGALPFDREPIAELTEDELAEGRQWAACA